MTPAKRKTERKHEDQQARLPYVVLTNRDPLMALPRQVGWFVAACLLMLMLVTCIPGISLWHPMLPGY